MSSISLKAASQSATVLKSTPTHDDADDNTSLELKSLHPNDSNISILDYKIQKSFRHLQDWFRNFYDFSKSSGLKDVVNLEVKSSSNCSFSFSKQISSCSSFQVLTRALRQAISFILLMPASNMENPLKPSIFSFHNDLSSQLLQLIQCCWKKPQVKRNFWLLRRLSCSNCLT